MGTESDEDRHSILAPPAVMTAAARDFFVDAHTALGAMALFVALANRVDHVDKVLDDMAREVELPVASGTRPSAAEAVRARYGRYMRETILVRAVDNFLAYVGDLLSLVYHARPEVLRSPDTVRMDEVLQFKAMEDFVAFAAERRVGNVTQQGVRDLHDDMSRRFGIPLFGSDDEIRRAVILVEIRNSLVHRRGIADRRFIERVGADPATVGKPINLPLLSDDLEFLGAVVRRIDEAVATKFGLPMDVSDNDVLEAVRGPADRIQSPSPP